MNKDTSVIWQEFSEKIKAFIAKRVSNQSVVNDILQDVFIKIHTKINTLKDNTKLHAWVYQIARNSVNDYFRNSKYEEKNNLDRVLDNLPEDDDLMVKIAEGLHEFMDELPAKYCDAMCKTELEGLTQVEYAKQTGISTSGAKSRVQRGRQMLKDMLMKCCHFQFDKYGTIIDYHPISCCCCHQYFKDTPEEKKD